MGDSLWGRQELDTTERLGMAQHDTTGEKTRALIPRPGQEGLAWVRGEVQQAEPARGPAVLP